MPAALLNRKPVSLVVMVPAPKLSLPGWPWPWRSGPSRLHLARRIDHQQPHGLGDQRDRREIVDRIVGRRACRGIGSSSASSRSPSAACSRRAAPLTTSCAPITVLAPGRFSITTGWPKSSLIFWPIRRASTSEGPPAGNGTTMWIARLGKSLAASCAAAGATQERQAAQAQATDNVRTSMAVRCALNRI